MSGPRASDPSLCPSGDAGQADAQVFAIAGAGEDGAAAYLDRLLPVDEHVIALASPLLPANVYRVATPCANSACAQFEGGKCQVAARIAAAFAPQADVLPPCVIRPACRWWRQEGVAACLRCPQIVTVPLVPGAADMEAAGAAGIDARRG